MVMKRSPKSAEGRQFANETACGCPPRTSKAFLRGGEKLVLDAQQHRYKWEDRERVKELLQEGAVHLELVSLVNLAE